MPARTPSPPWRSHDERIKSSIFVPTFYSLRNFLVGVSKSFFCFYVSSTQPYLVFIIYDRFRTKYKNRFVRQSVSASAIHPYIDLTLSPNENTHIAQPHTAVVTYSTINRYNWFIRLLVAIFGGLWLMCRHHSRQNTDGDRFKSAQ